MKLSQYIFMKKHIFCLPKLNLSNKARECGILIRAIEFYYENQTGVGLIASVDSMHILGQAHNNSGGLRLCHDWYTHDACDLE